MGKRLIIKGADFSQNGIAAIATRVKAVTTSVDNQVVKLVIPSALTSSANFRIKFAEAQLITTEVYPAFLGESYSGRTQMVAGAYTDGRIIALMNGKRPSISTPIIPIINRYYDIFVKTNETIIDGVAYQNTVGSAISEVECNGFATLFGRYGSNFPASSVLISEFEVYSNDGNTLQAKYVAAKDTSNRACFWNILTDELCYANSGELVAVTD